MKLSQKNLIRTVTVAYIALYNFVLFMITDGAPREPVFWISYGFIMLSPLLLLFLTFFPFTFTGGTNLVNSMPLYRTIALYTAVEFVAGTLLMIFKKHASVKLALVIQVPLLLAFTIVFFIYMLGANHISSGYERQKTEVFSLNMLQASVNTVAGACEYPRLSESLRAIAEKIKYSDYRSYPETRDLEGEMRETVEALHLALDDEIRATQLAKRLDRLVEQRRETCKYVKKMRG